jgi:hypothetical protein
MPSYITATQVRGRSGIPTSLMTDAEINTIIDQVESEMERYLNTALTPRTNIDILDGNGTEIIFTQKNPLLKVISIECNDSSIDADDVYVHEPSGEIYLGDNASASYWTNGKNNTFIKYIYGMQEEDLSTTTDTSADVVAGTSVSIGVTSSSSFAVNDWVKIKGMDGYKEVFKISAITDSTHITADQLIAPHESGSMIIKMRLPQTIKNYMLNEASIAVAITAIGETYTFNASYQLGELQVTKGVPYTHWRESVEKLMKERARLQNMIKPRPVIMVQ